MNDFYHDMGCGYGLNTVDADTLMNRPLPKEKFVVEGLLPQGVNLLCGSAKIGKSWLVLDLALKVALGEPFWDMATARCDVLYLCLEGTGKNRTQRIKIHYRFIGALEIPATPVQNYHKLNTRRGVVVEYLPNTVTA